LRARPQLSDKTALHGQGLSFEPEKGEQTAQAGVIAFYEKVIKVKADVAAFLN